MKNFKKKIKDFIFNVKLMLIMWLLIILVVTGVISEMWPKIKFNWPLAICVISGTLMLILIKLL